MKFLVSVKDEMKRVTWPSGKKLRRDVKIVIQTSIIFAIVFYAMDSAVQAIMNLILK